MRLNFISLMWSIDSFINEKDTRWLRCSFGYVIVII